MSAIPSPPQAGTSITRPPGSGAVTAIGVAALETLTADVLALLSGLSVASGGLTVTAGGLTVTAGGLTVTDGGVTITDDGLTITDDGIILTDDGIVFNGTSESIVQPVTSLLFRDHANANTNITVLDSGATTVRGAITPTGGVAAAGGFSATPCGQIHTGGAPATAAADGSELTPTTTSVYTVEIFVPCNMTLTGVRHFNGSDVTGNITVALYTSAGVAIAAAVSAATAGSGTDAYQSIPFATPYAAVGPAKYLIGFQYSSASARPNCHLIGTAFGIVQASATIGVTAISPLPTAFVATTQPIASLY